MYSNVLLESSISEMKGKGKTVQIKQSSHAAALQTLIVQHLTVSSPSRLQSEMVYFLSRKISPYKTFNLNSSKS